MREKAPNSWLRPLLALLTLTLLFAALHNVSLTPNHDEPLNLTFATPSFRYAVATHRNTRGNRCGLIRCGQPSAVRTTLTTSCDRVEVSITAAKTNLSARLCPVDFLNAHWDSLSRTYNEGLQFVSDSLTLREDSALLPSSPRAVHFPHARNNLDISPAWFSIHPSNATRAVIRAWYRAITAVPPTATAPDQSALNRARTCRAPDVVCHPRASAIRAQCDGLAGSVAAACSRGAARVVWIAAALQALTLLAAARFAANAARAFLPRRRAHALTALMGGVRGRRTEVAAFLFAGLLLLACVPRWPEMVRVVARPLSVSVVHTLDPRHLAEATDFFAGVPDLRGRYEGYAYVFADGADRVRIAGPGTGAVLLVMGVALAMRQAVEDGLLVRCLIGLGVVRLFCVGVVGVAGVSGRQRTEEEEEYADRKSEAAFLRRGKERSRSFLSSKGRIVVT